MAGKLILARGGQWLNRRYSYKVFIDGVETGRIDNDKTEEFELTPGEHNVQCRFNWMSSNVKTVDIKEGTNSFLKVSNGMKFYIPLYILTVAGILFPLYFRFAKLPVPHYANTVTIALVIPTVLYSLIYATILRKSYFVIGEDKSNPFS